MANMLHLDPGDPLPLYAQLERAIKLAIATGKMVAGSQLPTVRQLAVDLKVNANTVAKVYAELESQGVLSSRRGVGTFVQAQPSGSTMSSAQRADELRKLSEQFLTDAVWRGFGLDEVLLQITRLCSHSKEKRHAQR